MKVTILRGVRLTALVGSLVAALSVSSNLVPAQTSPSSPAEPKQAPATAPAGPDRKEPASVPLARGGLEVLSDTMGVDFGPYLKRVVENVRQNWYTVIPQTAKWRKGKASIEFAITKDGTVSGMRLVGTSNDTSLDRAAWGGIANSNPFRPLPAAFTGKYLALRMSFYYNPDPSETKTGGEGKSLDRPGKTDGGSDSGTALGISPSGSLKLEAGSTQQFSANMKTVAWTIVGDQCVKADCGTISAVGLYTAPGKVPQALEINITATQTSAPFKSASTVVTIVAPSSSAAR